MPDPIDRKPRQESHSADVSAVPAVLAVMDAMSSKLAALDSARRTKSLFIFGGTDVWTAIATSKVLRRLGKITSLEVILESPGGDLDFAIKIYKMLRAHCERLTVIVPFWAKSAASLIALSADRVLLTPYGELGPIDAQVEDPETGEFVPAHSIGRALDFIESTDDRWVKVSLAMKLSPMLIGGYLGVVSAGEQEVKEVCIRLKIKDPDLAVQALTSKYLSHGYPVTAETLREHGFPIEMISDAEAEQFMELHDLYIPLMNVHQHKDHECLTPVVVQSATYRVAVWDDQVVAEAGTPLPLASGSPPAAHDSTESSDELRESQSSPAPVAAAR